MTIIYGNYNFVFDSVQFGIDVRIMRQGRDMTQESLGALLGHKSGQMISSIECAQYDNSLSMSNFVALCNILGLRPDFYWDCEPA